MLKNYIYWSLIQFLAANAGASSQSFNQGGGFGGGLSGSSSNAAASSQTFNQVCPQTNLFKLFLIISSL